MRNIAKSSYSECEEPVPVSELRQYHFCPRVVYYHVLGVKEVEKEYMKAGKEKQEEIWSRERRRKTLAGLRRLKVDERVSGLYMTSWRLCLAGTLDLAVRMGKEWAVVEVKGSRRPKDVPIGHRVQGAAYSMLLEERMGTLTRRFFLLYEDELVEVPMTREIRDHTMWTVKQVLRIYRGKIPRIRRTKKCSSCGYEAYCWF